VLGLDAGQVEALLGFIEARSATPPGAKSQAASQNCGREGLLSHLAA